MKIALDIDGTLLDYNYIPGSPPVVNMALIKKLATEGITSVTLVTNQGGLAFGWAGRDRTDGRKYPSPSDFLGRLASLSQALGNHNIDVVAVYVSLYHPKADPDVLESIRNSLYAMVLFWQPPRLLVYVQPEYRKPSPGMLVAANVSSYYGDSDEDEQAAQLAGIEFIRVPRFTGGGS